ncbi:response regulator [Sulfitobacter sp. JB4-11]|uniref:response regulator n=1 Tax=Sulfitobacter rhodophyticola TaxID=3238304 RepID=UPI003D818B54
MLQFSRNPIPLPFPLLRTRDLRVLLLDDSSFDCQRIRRLSGKTGLRIDLDEVHSIAQMDRAVARTRYDLMLIDYRLPQGDGMVALDRVLDAPRNRDAAKIMITGNSAALIRVQALRRGCHEFIIKAELDANMLRRAMINALALSCLRQPAFDRVQRVGRIDPATPSRIPGLPPFEFERRASGRGKAEDFRVH